MWPEMGLRLKPLTLISGLLACAAGIAGPKGRPEIRMISYGCHLELPWPQNETNGHWMALSYSTYYAKDSMVVVESGKGPARLEPVQIKVVRCGGKEIGEAFPDSDRLKIIGKRDTQVKWLFRGLRSKRNTAYRVPCGSWGPRPPLRGYGYQGWGGEFKGKPFTIELRQDSTSSEGADLIVFLWKGREQVLQEIEQDESAKLSFLGDLDGDGSPDLILSMETEKGIVTDTLYLSSNAKKPEWVHEVASLEESGE